MEVELGETKQQISLEVRYCCALLQHIGFSSNQTVDFLQDFDDTSISSRSAKRYYNQWKEKGNILPQHHHKGNPKYSDDDKELIVQSFKQNPQLTLSQATNSNQINPNGMSEELIRQTIKNSGLNAFSLPKVIPLKNDNEIKRLSFCKSHMRWKQQWHKIVFSDECSLYAQLIGRKYLWLEQKTEINKGMCHKRYVQPMKVMVFAAVSYQHGPLYIKKIEGKLTSEAYIEVLKDFFEKSEDRLTKSMIFQQDNATCHVSQKSLKWFADKQIEIIKWPASSPDFSAIENIWPLIKNHIWNNRMNLKSKDDIFELAQKFFFESEEIKITIKNSYDSLPQRIKDCIEKNGGPINI
ncbi:hypothetical protein ABPG72_018368 [Tetrahymena utriculariae]